MSEPDENENIRKFPIQTIAIPTAILVIIFTIIFLHTESDRLRTYPLTEYDITLPDDSLSIEHGRRVFTIRGCVDCHEENAAGRIVQTGLMTGIIAASNLTPGEGSAISG